MSQVDLVAHTTPSIALLNAICRKFDRNDVIAGLNIPHQTSVVEVKLTVNGVEIDFEKMVEELWRQANDNANERARQLAKDMIRGTKLQGLFEVMEKAEFEIGEALDKALEEILKDRGY